MATLQVKGMDNRLYQALSRRAQLDNRSISQEVIKIIEDHLATPPKTAEQQTNEFLKLSGSWEDSRSAKAIARDMKNSRKNRNPKRSPSPGF